MSPANDKKPNPKVQQFLDEINRVCDHYQYTMQPILTYTPNGIIPQMRVIDKPPKPLNETQPKSADPAGESGGGAPSKPDAKQPASPAGKGDNTNGSKK